MAKKRELTLDEFCESEQMAEYVRKYRAVHPGSRVKKPWKVRTGGRRRAYVCIWCGRTIIETPSNIDITTFAATLKEHAAECAGEHG